MLIHVTAKYHTGGGASADPRAGESAFTMTVNHRDSLLDVQNAARKEARGRIAAEHAVSPLLVFIDAIAVTAVSGVVP